MAGEIEAIEKVVWTYLDGLHEGDTGKLGQAFHEVSHLYSMDKAARERPAAREMVRVRQGPPVRQVARASSAPTASSRSTCRGRRRRS